jgi:mRNA-degrading endonuclease RelE of RelBE toxin-antitoxin system
MTYNISVQPKASKEALRAYKYYEEIRNGLGERFLKELNIVFTSLSLYPTNFSFIDEGKILRDVILKVFPYTVIYKIDGMTVVIVTIHNSYRNPKRRYSKS